MNRTYLRYVPHQTFGVIATPRGNSILGESDDLAITPALRDVAVWNLKQGSLVRRISPEASTGGVQDAEEVSQLLLLPNGRVAAGYTTGLLRVFSLAEGRQDLAFLGHRTEVTALSTTADGAFLASGAKDTDVVVWDTIAETGVCRLKGHRHGVTAVLFLQRRDSGDSPGFFGLVSASQDALVKVWDVTAQHCLQTITGHRAEVWAMALDPKASRLVTGTRDSLLRVFCVHREGEGGGGLNEGESERTNVSGVEGQLLPEQPPLQPMGAVTRQLPDKVTQISWHPSGRYFAVLAPGKALEVFFVRNEEESQRKMKRRLRRKKAREAAVSGEAQEAEDGVNGAEDGQLSSSKSDMIAGDEIEFYALLRSTHKIQSFAFPQEGGDGKSHTRVLLALKNNSLEVHRLPLRHGLGKKAGSASALIAVNAAGEGKIDQSISMPVRTMVLDMHGHRSDVRAVSISSDSSLVASVSAYGVKIWNRRTSNCIRSAAIGGLALCCTFAPGDRHVVIGTREGCICALDLGSGDIVENIQAHDGAVWDVALRPDNTGLASASADKSVKFWDFELHSGGNLGFVHTRTLNLTEDALCVEFSHTEDRAKLLVAVALLDCTIKVFYDDTLKFFLSLYGHKLPALSMAISYDSSLLVSGSADKTIKIWGLDFGDCHKSILAHDDSVLSVKFIRGTHLFFTVSKDKTLKYWDADSYEQILTLRGHTGEIWSLAISRDGASVITGSHDRSIRIWERTQEPVFIEEEREKELDMVFEGELNRDAREDDVVAEEDDEESQTNDHLTTKRSLETINSGERLLEALELAHREWVDLRKHEDAKAAATAEGMAQPEARAPSILLLGLSPVAYVLRAFRMVKSQHLEQALIVASVAQVEMILEMCCELLQTGLGVEIISRAVVILLRIHAVQISSSSKMRPVLTKIQQHLRPELHRLRHMIGTNQAALECSLRLAKETSSREEDTPFAAEPTRRDRAKRKRKK